MSTPFQLEREISLHSNPDVTEHPLVYAGFWSRVWATLIDTVAQFIVLWPILYVARFAGDVAATLIGLTVNLLLPVALVTGMWMRFGATPGKMVIGAKVVDASTGLPPTRRQAVIRYFSYLVSMMPFGLGFLVVAWSRRKQGWHDKIANTVVVRKGEWQLSSEGKIVAVE